MGRKKKYIEMFGSFTEPFNCMKQAFSGKYNKNGYSQTYTSGGGARADFGLWLVGPHVMPVVHLASGCCCFLQTCC